MSDVSDDEPHRSARASDVSDVRQGLRGPHDVVTPTRGSDASSGRQELQRSEGGSKIGDEEPEYTINVLRPETQHGDWIDILGFDIDEPTLIVKRTRATGLIEEYAVEVGDQIVSVNGEGYHPAVIASLSSPGPALEIIFRRSSERRRLASTRPRKDVTVDDAGCVILSEGEEEDGVSNAEWIGRVVALHVLYGQVMTGYGLIQCPRLTPIFDLDEVPCPSYVLDNGDFAVGDKVFFRVLFASGRRPRATGVARVDAKPRIHVQAPFPEHAFWTSELKKRPENSSSHDRAMVRGAKRAALPRHDSASVDTEKSAALLVGEATLPKAVDHEVVSDPESEFSVESLSGGISRPWDRVRQDKRYFYARDRALETSQAWRHMDWTEDDWLEHLGKAGELDRSELRPQMPFAQASLPPNREPRRSAQRRPDSLPQRGEARRSAQRRSTKQRTPSVKQVSEQGRSLVEESLEDDKESRQRKALLGVSRELEEFNSLQHVRAGVCRPDQMQEISRLILSVADTIEDDGMLSMLEFTELLKNAEAKNGDIRSFLQWLSSDSGFVKFDTSGDGRLSLDELRSALQVFARERSSLKSDTACKGFSAKAMNARDVQTETLVDRLLVSLPKDEVVDMMRASIAAVHSLRPPLMPVLHTAELFEEKALLDSLRHAPQEEHTSTKQTHFSPPGRRGGGGGGWFPNLPVQANGPLYAASPVSPLYAASPVSGVLDSNPKGVRRWL
mmetsp:Transcript_1548/g.3427  ORF Transcript_1548/g.3427 Transcript_1548/m.3427 type:complete len:730 (-) Transcript_1548:36-2225(-)